MKAPINSNEPKSSNKISGTDELAKLLVKNWLSYLDSNDGRTFYETYQKTCDEYINKWTKK